MSETVNFVPNVQIMSELLAMGIEKHVAEVALYNTGNESCDAAVAFVFDSADRSPPRRTRSRRTSRRARLEARKAKDPKDSGGGSQERLDTYEQFFKMVFVVNSALEMSPGKVASQVAHACLGLYRTILFSEATDYDDDLDNWEEFGEKKVVLKGTNHMHLTELERVATLAGLPAYIVRDAGHTEVMPGSVTVLAVFGNEAAVTDITGDLNLL